MKQSALLTELLDAMASPPARALHTAVLTGERDYACRLICEERFSPENADRIYDECVALWRGADIEMTEVPLADVSALLAANQHLETAQLDERPRYLVRQGHALKSASGFTRGEEPGLLTSEGFIELRHVQQFWVSAPKASALVAGEQPPAPVPPLTSVPTLSVDELHKLRAAKTSLVNELIATGMPFVSCGAVSYRLEQLIKAFAGEPGATVLGVAPPSMMMVPADKLTYNDCHRFGLDIETVRQAGVAATKDSTA